MQKLNLHGISHEDVESEIIRFIESNWDSGNKLEVVTGNSRVMQHLVKKVADEYKLECTLGKFNSPNCGCVYIQT